MVATASVAIWPAQAATDEVVDVCGENPGWLCEVTWNATNSRFLARLVDGILTPILTAIVVLIVAALVNRYLRKLVTAFIVQVTRKDKVAGSYLGKLGVSAGDDERERVRATTLSAVARTTVSAVVWVFAVLAILGIFSINLGPLIAGAGIAGIAVGLGAQQLVKDCIAGFFILLEDQCGVGDEIDVGPAIGMVEAITLRATTLRDGNGTVWTVPNGTILRIGNKSRDWSQGNVDLTFADATKLDEAVTIIERVAGEVSADPQIAPLLVEPIGVPGVENLGTMGPVVRVTVRTSAGDNAGVMRTLRATLMRELEAAGIHLAAPLYPYPPPA
jgi:moderate conductance mechanosensitive channel